MTPSPEAPESIGDPRDSNSTGRRASNRNAGFRIQELQTLHANIRVIFILMSMLSLIILAYMAVRVFVLKDIRSYVEFGSLCLFSFACVALTVGLLHSLRSIRHGTREKIERMTFVDDLTGVYNYRFLEQRLIQELQRAKRHGADLSVIYLDVDGFKQVNDTFGHETGNAVLRRIAQTCNVSARGEDFVGRLGGDEFLLVLPETDVSGASIAAERVRKKLESLELVAANGERIDFLGYSLGVASYPANAQATDELIRGADQAMYRAKKSGGNRVCL